MFIARHFKINLKNIYFAKQKMHEKTLLNNLKSKYIHIYLCHFFPDDYNLVKSHNLYVSLNISWL